MSEATKNKKEVREFMECISTDFYLDLKRYQHFPDSPFESANLSITQLLKICESHMFSLSSSKYLINELDIPRVISLVLHRVGNCGNKKLAKQATNVISEMECYTYIPEEEGRLDKTV